MLVFPQWRPEMTSEGCRLQRWIPAEHFAAYVARPPVIRPSPEVEDENSSGGLSPERNELGQETKTAECGWIGCHLQFSSVVRLSAHVARSHAHARSDGLFYCGWETCSRPQRGFNARYKMLVHVRTHTNERPHRCNQCNKRFSRAENLKIHLRSHSGEKPYVCPYEGCKKAYSNSSDRFKHTKTHTVDKPYCCKLPGCNKRYTDPSSLRKHVKSYKHFSPKDPTQKDSSDEMGSPETSPTRHNFSYKSPEMQNDRVTFTSPNLSSIPPYNPILPIRETAIPPSLTYPTEQLYITPLDSIYSFRVPSHEMSYVEYTQMYEHAYRNYYSNINYSVIQTNVTNNINTYEPPPLLDDIDMNAAEDSETNMYREMPLNLKRLKRPNNHIKDIIRCTELPLDLSRKN